MRLKLLTFLLFVLAGSLSASAQLTPVDSAKFAEYEVDLQRLSHNLMNIQIEAERQKASDSIDALLTKVLAEPNSYYYPFDSMKTVFRLKTEDKKIRIFTWAVILNSGEHIYHGIIQLNPKKFKKELPETIIKLKSNAPTEDLLYQDLTTDNWYGALYYQVKKIKYKKAEYYVLLGYDGNDRSTNIKIIDVLTLDEDFTPHFGAPLFFMGKDFKNAQKEYKAAKKEAEKYEDDPIRQANSNQKAVAPLFQKRILFYFNDEVVMTLRFENDGEFIIWDHLVPIKGDVGEFSKYYPDGTYDYVKYKKGVFSYYEMFFSNEKIDAKPDGDPK